MNALISTTPGWFALALNLSLQATLLCAFVFVVTKALGRWIPPSWRALLWFLVIARALIPAAPPTPFSLQNLFVAQPPVARPVLKAPLISEGGGVAKVDTDVPVDIPLVVSDAAALPKAFPWVLALAGIWSSGAALSLAILATRSLVIRRRLLKRGLRPPLEIVEALKDCQDLTRCAYPISVTASDEIAAPALTGLLPARLIIPANFASENFSGAQIRQIFRHELAHVQLGHLLFHWVTLVARCVHWFNPFIHYAAMRLRQECELAADSAALKNSSEDERVAYGETILQVLARTTAPSTALALGMAEQARHLEQRLRALKNAPRQSRLVAVAALFALTLTGLSDPQREPPPDDATPLRPKVRGLRAARQAAAARAILDARVLIERSDFEQAKQLLQEAKKLDPQNHASDHYLDVLNEIKIRDTGIKVPQTTEHAADFPNSGVVLKPLQPSPVPDTSTVRNTSTARSKIYEKLDSIRIDSFPLAEETELMAVLKDLSREIKQRDPSGRGVNFIISQSRDATANPSSAIDPITGFPQSLPGDADVERFRVKFDPLIRDVTLRQLLDAIVMVAKPPLGAQENVFLKYSVEDYAVVFSQGKRALGSQLYSRTFNVNPNTFQEAREGIAYLPNPSSISAGAASETNRVQAGVRAFFAAAGVEFPTNSVTGIGAAPQKAIFFNDKTGVLFVRATFKDLDIIENALQTIYVKPPQITFSVQIAESTADVGLQLATKFEAMASNHSTSTNEYVFAQPAGTNSVAKLQLAASRRIFENLNGSLTSTSSVSPIAHVLLTEAQARDLRKSFENTTGIDFLTMPNVTTLLNRQARVSIEETRTILTAQNFPGGGQVPFGPVADLIATRITENAIRLEFVVTRTEFLGYVDSTAAITGAKTKDPIPLPTFRVQQSAANEEIPFNSSLLLVLDSEENWRPATAKKIPVLGDIPALGRLFRSERNTPEKARQVFILITPNLVDPAGNRIDLKK